MSTHLSRRFLAFLSVVVVLPVVVFAARAVEFNLTALINPCMGYGAGSGTITIVQGGRCSVGVSSSEPVQGLVTTILIPGGMLIGSALGVLGTLRDRSTILAASFVILALESVPLGFDGLFVLTLIPAVFFVWEARTKFSFR